jgi:hypothetical protein
VNKFTEENPAKSKPSPGWPREVRLPPEAARPPHPKNLAAGQPSTPHRSISWITPLIASKLRGWLGYLLGNLFLKGINPKCSQSKEIVDLGPLGQELEQLEKPPNRDRCKGVHGERSPTKEAQGPHTWHPNKNPARNHPQNSATKITTKSSENHKKGGWERQHKALRNHAESSIHTMKVHTRSSLPLDHPSLFLDLTWSSQASPRKLEENENENEKTNELGFPKLAAIHPLKSIYGGTQKIKLPLLNN